MKLERELVLSAALPFVFKQTMRGTLAQRVI